MQKKADTVDSLTQYDPTKSDLVKINSLVSKTILKFTIMSGILNSKTTVLRHLIIENQFGYQIKADDDASVSYF